MMRRSKIRGTTIVVRENRDVELKKYEGTFFFLGRIGAIEGTVEGSLLYYNTTNTAIKEEAIQTRKNPTNLSRYGAYDDTTI
jgi:hypothetical protein